MCCHPPRRATAVARVGRERLPCQAGRLQRRGGSSGASGIKASMTFKITQWWSCGPSVCVRCCLVCAGLFVGVCRDSLWSGGGRGGQSPLAGSRWRSFGLCPGLAPRTSGKAKLCAEGLNCRPSSRHPNSTGPMLSSTGGPSSRVHTCALNTGLFPFSQRKNSHFDSKFHFSGRYLGIMLRTQVYANMISIKIIARHGDHD